MAVLISGVALSNTSTPLPTANGGTGLSTVGTAGQVLTSNGTTLYWAAGGGGGGSVTLPATQIAFGDGSNVLSSNADLAWSESNKQLILGTGGAAASITVNNTGGLYLIGDASGTTVGITTGTSSTYVYAADLTGIQFSVSVPGLTFQIDQNGGWLLGGSTMSPGNVGDVITSTGDNQPVWTTLRVATAPTSSGSAGEKGQYFSDANYFYYCYATNSWRRIAGSTF